ncbi:RNA polymerase sigma-70 factor [Fictibacillus sp. KU28468]|uniref:RNA polymerase sigma-70 factor n=1 Tax=Fictibacillus sp. KU28468 TaxID=2991053 RepID=UPI00223C9F0E|nr:RNA polymerase sigma-70 factor [Fictibacillus sp. KU28468]UZJ81164.1 RNA polymerase sigma-70 factor [Fictibacillus sp. KU28468]
MDTEMLYTTHRPLLFSLAYRMLGSVQDAEDIIQDTFIALNGTEAEHIQNIKAYLSKMVTNRCIDRLKSARKKREQYVGEWLPEPLLTENTQSEDPAHQMFLKESVSMAYLLLLQQLSETERAVFLLKEVLQYNYEDIAEMVGKSSTNCRQIFHRAKKSIGPSEEKKITKKGASLTEQFFRALTYGDTDTLLSLLSVDATLVTDGGGKIKAAIFPILGADRISRFYQSILPKLPKDVSYTLTTVNSEPGMILTVGGRVYAVMSLHIENNRIQNIYSVMNPDKLTHISA